MARPCKDDPRDWNFTLRLSIAERTRLQREARSSGLNLAASARRRLFQNAAAEVARSVRRDDGSAPPTGGMAPATELAVLALTEQIRRAGVNLNQIARRLHEYRLVSPDELHAALDELRACLRQFVNPAP